MQRDKPFDERVYDPEHIRLVLAELTTTFPTYYARFCSQPISLIFLKAILDYEGEQIAYTSYMDLASLEEFEDDPNPFKRTTRAKCPIIHRCLMSQDDIMKQYKISFNETSGRQLLNSVKNIAQFGIEYNATFNDSSHEQAKSFTDLNLSPLNESGYGCAGVIGYGVQSSLLYGQYPHSFAHRSQNAVWALYFITNHKDFGLDDGSEFMMIQPKYNTCEQNYFYPADLFGFYSLKLYLLRKQACAESGIQLENRYRYIYLSTFTDFVADFHRKDIEVFKWSSDHADNNWH